MLQKIIKRAKAIGFTDFEITVNSSKETNISVFNGNVEKNFLGSDITYTLKGLIDNKKSIYIFQKNNEDLTDDEIDKCLYKLKENICAIKSKEKSSIFAGSPVYPVVEKIDADFSNIDNSQKIDLLKNIEKECLEYDKRIELVPYCNYVEESNGVKIVNSKGLNLEKSNEYCGVVLGVVAGENKEDQNKQNGFEIKIANQYSELNKSEIVDKACSLALSMLGAAPVDSKEYPVIMENEAMASLLGGFFSMFSAEALIKKMTALAGKVNEKIMNNKITIYDDPLNEKAIVKEPFDSEGVATYKKEVVKNGVFKMFLQNLKTANYFKTTSTGNASTNGIQPMNFHIAAGNISKEDMISSLEEGLLINDLSGLHAGLNPVSGDFSAQARGYLIEHGKITKPVTLIVVSGNFLKIMSEVLEVGNDLKIGYNGFGAPSILFNSLPVSGK